MNKTADTVQAGFERFRTRRLNPYQHKARVAANNEKQPKGGNEVVVLRWVSGKSRRGLDNFEVEVKLHDWC